MTETELKQIAWDAQIESEKLQYLKDRAKETLVISEKCYQKRRDLEDLYYMVDDELVLAALNTAQAEEIKAFDAYRFWLMQAEEHKTGE
jgi:hypothetical protein